MSRPDQPVEESTRPRIDRTADQRGGPALALPDLWRGVALLVLGVGALVAITGGDAPSAFSRDVASLAMALFGLVALGATLNRSSAISELSLLDGLVFLALLTSAVATLHAPIRSEPARSLLWQASLAGLYGGARLIGPFLMRPALLLWAVGLGGLWILHAVEPGHLSIALMTEWTIALLLLGACAARQAWARRISTLGWRNVRRAILAALIVLGALVHFHIVSGGEYGQLLHQRAVGWRAARILIWQHPLWGWGGGTWSSAMASLAEPPTIGEPLTLTAGMWVLTAGGAAGALAVAVLVVGLFATLMGARRAAIPSRMNTPLMAVGAIGLAWGLMGLWSLAPVRPANLILFTFFTGTALSSDLLEVTAEAPIAEPRRWLRLAVWSVAMGVGVTVFTLVGLGLFFSWWTQAAPSAEAAMRRAHVASLLMPWEHRWPALEAEMAGLTLVHHPDAPEGAQLRSRRELAHARARRLHPWLGDLYVVPAEEMLLRGQTERAEALLREGLAHLPLDAAMRWDLALILERRGDVQGAYETLRPLDRVHPTGETKAALARLCWALGNRDLAQRFAREALQLDHMPGALLALAAEMGLWAPGS